MEKTENKRIKTLGVVIGAIVLGVIISFIITKTNNDKLVQSISDAKEQKGSTSIYIMKTGCTYCEMFESSVNELEDIGYNYIKVDLSKLSEDQISKLAYITNLGVLNSEDLETISNYIDSADLDDATKTSYKELTAKNYLSSSNKTKIQTDMKEKLSEDDYTKFESLLSSIGAYSTPTTVIVGDGKVKDQEIGYTTPKVLYNFLFENGVISEKKSLLLNYPTLDETIDMINDGENHVFVLAKSSCSHCINFHSVLLDLLKETNVDINYLYLDYTLESEDDETKLYKALPWLTDNFEGTPTTVIVNNGEVKAYVEGENTKIAFKQFLTDNGIIK